MVKQFLPLILCNLNEQDRKWAGVETDTKRESDLPKIMQLVSESAKNNPCYPKPCSRFPRYESTLSSKQNWVSFSQQIAHYSKKEVGGSETKIIHVKFVKEF